MIVGVTGHQNIGDCKTVNWVEQTLNRLISEEKPSMGLTCLARGADQLYAQILLNHSVPYTAIIACQDYESTFDDDHQVLENYKSLLSEASRLCVLDNAQASEEAFYEAGKALVEASDYIIAVWDGQAARGLGGTGDIVKYALDNNKRVVHLNTLDFTISTLPSGATN